MFTFCSYKSVDFIDFLGLDIKTFLCYYINKLN